jgi:peptidoglycan/xylan/chitin deacetylase (PgdA/CDA1 family)
VRSDLRKILIEHGFEVGVHGLNHDGKLFRSKQIFSERFKKINDYLKQWNAVGFRAPAMHHNLDWIHDLNIEYDASTFDTDPFEPMPDGYGSIFPFLVNGTIAGRGYVELPYTLPQDFTVLVLMRDDSLKIWKKKLDWLAQKGGMALLNTHPDYMAFGSAKRSFAKYPASYYEKFLLYVSEKYSGQYWHALPKEVARYWRLNQCGNSP